jgi:hypothetical protein
MGTIDSPKDVIDATNLSNSMTNQVLVTSQDKLIINNLNSDASKTEIYHNQEKDNIRVVNFKNDSLSPTWHPIHE